MQLFIQKASTTFLTILVTGLVFMLSLDLTGSPLNVEDMRWQYLLIGIAYGAPFVIFIGLPLSIFVDQLLKVHPVLSYLIYVGTGGAVGAAILTDGFQFTSGFSLWNVIMLSSMLSATSFYLIDRLMCRVLNRRSGDRI
ncbi:hypothetical protein CIG75_07005 [Tumebacillus algifaecis]|uniref:Uncharacterized protein n=1 Tax=Tumebacillus algifaecis TaxID=1214604 RepID=A0A223D057_9BACL|nr:hypothetical protein [Tumebacillus algifaecis]ASS74747.1 hypothetical protein CIG75_07005 [Tumebacillus algifaecis]